MRTPLNGNPITRTVQHNPGLFFAEGIAMMLLGVLAIALPVFASLAVTALLGWLLFTGGVFSLVSCLLNRHTPGFLWSVASSLITVGAGTVFFAWPFSGMISLTLALAAFLLVDGILSVIMALEHRRHLAPKWSLLLVSGFVSIAFSAVLISWLPQISPWELGAVIGIDLFISGLSLAIITFDAVRA